MKNSSSIVISLLSEFRWFIGLVIILIIFMIYNDFTGQRMFDQSSQKQWNSSGPGYHK